MPTCEPQAESTFVITEVGLMFDDKIAELNRQTELHPPTFEKRTYTVSEIQDILGIGRNAAYAIV